MCIFVYVFVCVCVCVCVCVLGRQGGRESPPGPVGVATQKGPVGGGLRDTYFSPLSSLPPPGLSQGCVHPTGVSPRPQTPPAEDGWPTPEASSVR